ncbi:MAG: fibronectin type III domain-containing protein [Bacteroidales bacterium]|nr:fibronectin type III domain-containing protein [Bacteroidales bacterium]
MRKIIFSLVAMAALIACKEEPKEPIALSTPNPVLVEVTEDAALVSWEMVANAGGYTYRLNAGEERTTRDNEVRLENLTPETAYTFEVMANTASEEYLSSAWSKVEFSTAAYVPGFQIVVDETRTTAYSVEFDIVPDLKEKTYYYDLYSTARWNETTLAEIQAEIDASMHTFADMMDMTYEEVIEMMLSSGDQFNIYSGAGFRGNTEFCVFAFYWDVEEGMSSEASVVYFTTPEPKTSSERVDLFFDPVEPYNMTLTCEPSSGVQEYYLIFDTTERVEEILATMEDEEAILSYGAMNYGVKLSDLQVLEQQGLRPETSYTALVMAIDKQGNRFLEELEQTTPAEENKDLVESELFTSLLGEWTAVQTINDLYSGPYESRFTVNIVQEVPDYDYDYRSQNQLVALVDGWNSLTYYGVEALANDGIEDPELKFGPKWLINIAEGDVMTVDGQAHHSVIGWMFFGDCYFVNAKADGTQIYTDQDLEVTLSEDGNTLTIASPAGLTDVYPSLAYNFEGFGWMAYFCGGSNIVLTRK